MLPLGVVGGRYQKVGQHRQLVVGELLLVQTPVLVVCPLEVAHRLPNSRLQETREASYWTPKNPILKAHAQSLSTGNTASMSVILYYLYSIIHTFTYSMLNFWNPATASYDQ